MERKVCVRRLATRWGRQSGRPRISVPRAEAAAARCIERTRPVWSWLALEWRRLGTAAALALIVGLLLHAMYGVNGMVVYRQKASRDGGAAE